MFYRKYKNLASEKSFLIAIPFGLVIAIALLQPIIVQATTTIPVKCPDGYQTTVVRADQVEAACADHQTGGREADSTVIGTNPNEANPNDYRATAYYCGDPANDNKVTTSIDIGCRHKGNPILDMVFAIIRLLSIGVGLVVIGSIIMAGIQYTTSKGDPQATAKALNRVYSTFGALLLFIFAYAILNWLIPAGILQ